MWILWSPLLDAAAIYTTISRRNSYTAVEMATSQTPEKAPNCLTPSAFV